MPHLWVLIRALYPAALLLAAAASTSASLIRPDSAQLFGRADTCGQNFSPCSQPGLPANFCCETGATCNLLAANTTILCCPTNSNCDKISPITCDLGLQDPATNPSAEIKTTALNGVLTTCAGKCCPFGYSCDGTNCAKDADQSKKPPVKPTSSSSGTKTAGPSATSTHGSSTTTVAVSGIATAAPSTETPTTSTSGTANTVTIVGGVIGALVGLVLVVLAVVMLRHRRKKALREKQSQLQRHDSTSSFGNIISAPVPHANYPSQRLDFLAKQSHTTGSPKSYAPSSPTAVASPGSQRAQKDGFGGGGGETREYYGGFMPPNSPYAPYARRPDSQMSDAPRSYHGSAEISGLRSLTHWPGASAGSSPKGKGKASNDRPREVSPAPAPLVFVTPADGGGGDGLRDGARGRFGAREERDRYPSVSEGESINVFADPLMVPRGTGAARPDSSATTWSNIQQRADNAMHGGYGNASGSGNGRSRLGEPPLRR
ncbi:hypothetical protein F4781DRAFT_347274 [Annulohypoxylon bovei var. microspora]|nr:hypothetical protein F4781DRAFT_347274 [Annulohypoxylon bovei var. microspora]